jgi:CheY-like chemotaxis protein
MSEKKKIVLVIEDEVPLQRAIGKRLEDRGFEILTARTVEQALNNLADVGMVDVVWLDHYLMDSETGLDFITRIKENKKWAGIPIFVVSNTAGPEKVQEYIKFGVTQYYTKADSPLDAIIDDIVKTIAYCACRRA